MGGYRAKSFISVFFSIFGIVFSSIFLFTEGRKSDPLLPVPLHSAAPPPSPKSLSLTHASFSMSKASRKALNSAGAKTSTCSV